MQSGGRGLKSDLVNVGVQLPVLELAFFPRELQGELVGLDARTAVGSVITGLVTFRESLVWDRIAGDAQDKVSRYYVYIEIVDMLDKSIQQDLHGLGYSTGDEAVVVQLQLLRLLSTSAQGDRVALNQSEIAKVKMLPVFETLAGTFTSIFIYPCSTQTTLYTSHLASALRTSPSPFSLWLLGQATVWPSRTGPSP